MYGNETRMSKCIVTAIEHLVFFATSWSWSSSSKITRTFMIVSGSHPTWYAVLGLTGSDRRSDCKVSCMNCKIYEQSICRSSCYLPVTCVFSWGRADCLLHQWACYNTQAANDSWFRHSTEKYDIVFSWLNSHPVFDLTRVTTSPSNAEMQSVLRYGGCQWGLTASTTPARTQTTCELVSFTITLFSAISKLGGHHC